MKAKGTVIRLTGEGKKKDAEEEIWSLVGGDICEKAC